MPAIARHMAELHSHHHHQQQQEQPKKAVSQAQPKQAARLRAAATFTSSSAAPGEKPGVTGKTARLPATHQNVGTLASRCGFVTSQ